MPARRSIIFFADNGSAWYISGAPDERWDNDDLHELGDVSGADSEVVDTSSRMLDPDSGRSAGIYADGFESGTTAAWSGVVP